MKNLYLDIDGVLLTKQGVPALHLVEFLTFALQNFECYWLTTHCKGDASTALFHISSKVPPEPIITKELFDLVQGQIKSQVLRVEGKKFAFTKMMTCKLCGSGICADEKFKKKKGGGVHRYIYYGCTKARRADCKCGYTEEKEILKQFEELIDKINLNEIEVKEKIKEDIKRFSKMQKFFLGTKEKISIPSVDIRGYAKYILREGTDEEKREMLGCLKSKIYLAQKKITLEK